MSENSSIAVHLTKLSVIFAAALLVAQLSAAPASAQIACR